MRETSMTAKPRGTSRASPQPGEPTSEELAARVDRAVRRIAGLQGAARETAEEVKGAVEAVHRAGLTAIVRRMRQDERARELLFELIDDPVVHLLLSLHGIIQPGAPSEQEHVPDGARPSSRSPGGDTGWGQAQDAFVPLDSLWIGPGHRDAGWIRTHPLDEFPDGEITLVELVASSGRDVEVIVVRLGDRLSAYLNVCAHQGLPLEAALLDTDAETLTCPWHGYCFDATSGRCMSAPGAQLEQFALRVEDGQVWIRVGT